MKSSKLYGVGINDADYPVCRKVSGATVWCPFYRKWIDMLRRCYAPEYHAKNPSYVNCTVDKKWRRFSSFRAWMESKNWEGMHLDKDILIAGNKVYGPETCVFVSAMINIFVAEKPKPDGGLPTGVYVRRRDGKYRSHCKNPLTGKREMLGTFSDPMAAHYAWRKRKHELACLLADSLQDQRLSMALKSRYSIR